MRFTILLAAWAATGLGVCRTVVEQVDVLPDRWRRLDKAPDPSQQLHLSIAIRQPQIAGLGPRIVSGASSMTQKDTTNLVAPDNDDVEKVLKWLSENGVNGTVQKGAWIRIGTTVSKAESLLDAKIGNYAFDDKEPVLRTQKYSVPDSLAQAIDFVLPIANFMALKRPLLQQSPQPQPRELNERTGDSGACASMTTPACIRQLYGISYNETKDSSPVRFGIAGFLDEYANHQDVQAFLKQMAPSIASTGYNYSVELVHNGTNPQSLPSAGAEASLDMEYAMALGYPASITYFSTGGRGTRLDDQGKPTLGASDNNEPYLEFLQYLLDKPDSALPHILSISYADDELSVPRSYAERVCSLLGLLTGRGTTVLVGSGDGGARGASSSNCTKNDGSNQPVTMATFPGTCPWVTAVGAVTNSAANPPEGAVFSGGGFSQYFPRPAWQDSAVKGYISSLNGHLSEYYNASMRALPDISAIGTSFETYVGVQVELLQGTSASTPVLASMLALISDARIRQGKGPLGWINKKLYSDAIRSVLTDPTTGQSQSCIFNGIQPGGWPAAKGWDAITGVGVPADFDALMKVLLET